VPAPTWLDDVRRLLEQVRSSDASEVEISCDGFRLRVKRRPRQRPAAVVAVDGVDRPTSTGLAVLAQLTGVFYRSASPDVPSYVQEGDEVMPDTVVGLIETMKIFNEVVAECHGRVREVLVESGQLVHTGDHLMVVDEADQPAGLRTEP
jgi:acetyl-CoA carboxylase biotin carboxyl carrier protein